MRTPPLADGSASCRCVSRRKKVSACSLSGQLLYLAMYNGSPAGHDTCDQMPVGRGGSVI